MVVKKKIDYSYLVSRYIDNWVHLLQGPKSDSWRCSEMFGSVLFPFFVFYIQNVHFSPSTRRERILYVLDEL